MIERVKRVEYKEFTFLIDRITPAEEVKASGEMYGTTTIDSMDGFEIALAKWKAEKSKNNKKKWNWFYVQFEGSDKLDAETLQALYAIMGNAINTEIELIMKGMVEE